MKSFDYLIVGSGLYGATFAYFAKCAGKRCLVIDKRPHLGGNVYCEQVECIHVHKYGAHIFHTSNRKVWDFVNSFVPFNRYTNSPVANFKGKIYNSKTNRNGVAAFKIIKFDKKGSFNSKIIFAGNNYYKPLTKTVKIKIK